MNRVCRTEGHDYPTYTPQILGVAAPSATSLITGPCRRCGLDWQHDPATLSKRLTEITREFREFRHDVDVLLAAIDDRLTALEANGPQIVVNNAAPAPVARAEDETHVAYREGRLAAWQDLRDYVAKNLVVAENAPGVKGPR